MSYDISSRFRDRLLNKSLKSCSRWAENKIEMPNPYPGPVNFDRFPWERDILNIDEGFVTIKKAAQMGFSIAGLIRSLFVVDELKNDVLYVLPTAGLAGDFSQARLDGVINLSPKLEDLFTSVNKVGLKVTKHRSNLYFRGSVAGRNLVSVPISTAIIDEYDRCQEGTYELISERLSAQKVKYLNALSTPTLPDFGIDSVYQKGTQEQFFFQCPSCGKHETLRWPDNIVICGDGPGDPRCHESYLICTHCQNRLPHETKMDWLKTAKWVPQVTVHGHRSFHINQMFSTTVSPGELSVAYQKSLLSEHAMVEFKNQKLGEPHVVEGGRLTDKLIADCEGSHKIGEDRPENSSRMIVMGVDVGTFLDCTIVEYLYDEDPGTEVYQKSKAKLLQAVRLPGDDWHKLDNLMREWQVRHACVDFQPDTVNARAFCRRFRGHASMVQYRRGTAGNEIKEIKDEHRVPTLTVDRTSFLDMALGRFHRQTIEIPHDTYSVFRAHLKAPMRDYEYDELGLPRGVYRNAGDDHFAHSMVYAEIAHFREYVQTTGRTIKPGEKF